MIAVCLAFLATSLPAAETESSDKQLLVRIDEEISDHPDCSPKLGAFIREVLLPMCSNPVFSRSVLEHNSRNLTMDQIMMIDKTWIASKEKLQVRQDLLNNPCADEIRRLALTHTAIGECFVMGNQGAIVGLNQISSDYWQGDESKWRDSFK